MVTVIEDPHFMNCMVMAADANPDLLSEEGVVTKLSVYYIQTWLWTVRIQSGGSKKLHWITMKKVM